MPGNEVGSAYFQLLLNLESFNAGFQTAQRQAEAGSAKIQQSIDTNLKKAEQSASRFSENFKKGLEIGAGITGFRLGLETIHEAIEKVTKATLDQAQAQRGLVATFGTSASSYKAFADQLAESAGRVNSTLETGVSRIGALQQSFALTSGETQALSKAATNLAAVFGGDLSEAFRSVQAGVRGEAESLEKFNIFIQDSSIKTTKAFQSLTSEQQRNWETLNELTKARVRAAAILEQSAKFEGEATKRAQEAQGSFDKLERASDSLAKTLGQSVVPGLAKVADGLTTTATRAEATIKQFQALGNAGVKAYTDIRDAEAKYLSGGRFQSNAQAQQAADQGNQKFIRDLEDFLAGLPLPGLPAIIRAQRAARSNTVAGIADTRAADEGRHEGNDVADAEQQRRRQQALDRDAAKAALQQRRKDIEARAAMEVRAIEHERKAAEDAYSHERAILEQTKNAEIKAAEDSRDGQLRAIDAEAKATAKRYDDEVRAAETARDAAKRAAEDKKDAALKALDAEEQAAHDASDAQIRSLEIQRDRAKQTAEDTRDAAIRNLDAEKRARDNARVQEDRAEDDHNKDVQRRLDEQARAAERRFQREADAAEKAHQKDIDGIDRATRKEADRHQKVLDALQEEQDARLGLLDAQLKALDAQEKQVSAAERLANLNRTAQNAQEALTRARGTGSAADIATARGELTRAIRGGDEVSIANARERLTQLAGQGADAIKKAEQDLADAQQAIQDEQTKNANDAERDRLNAAKDAIREQIAAEKDAEDKRNQQRTRELAADKKSADDKYKAAKDGIDKRKRDEKDAHDLAVQQSRDVADKAKRDVEDRRRAEDQADQDKRREITDTYELEQRQIKATYDDEETGAIPAIRRARETADREYAARRDTINETYQTEQQQIKDTYDGPNGLIQHLHDQAKIAAEEYANRKQAVNDAYQAERDRIAEVYDDPVHGLFANLEAAKNKTIESLDAQKERWETWKTDTVKNIQDALDKLDEFLARVGALQQIGTVDINGQPLVPGGVGPPIPPGFNPGGDLAYGPVVRNASADSYWTSGGTHGGYPAADIFAPRGSAIYAPVGGTISTGSGSLGGNYAILTGDDGRAYYFAHGNVPFTSGRVERGAQIGEVGNTGNAAYTASHLHFAIASNSGFFGDHNGSGDIEGDSSYWGEGGTANPRGGDDEITIDILGRKLRIRTSGANIPGEVGQWIRQGIAIAGVPSSWAKPLAEIMAAESGQRNGDGTVVIGTGKADAAGPVDPQDGQQAYGAMQIKPGTFAQYAKPGHNYILSGPDSVATAALYILGRYGSPWNTPYYQTGAFDWRGVPGYANGGVISEPTLLRGLYSGRWGLMAERGPERILSAEDTRAGRGTGGGNTVTVNGVGMREVASEVMRLLKKEDLLRGVRR